jgi:protoheme IX farnesyltransferase
VPAWYGLSWIYLTGAIAGGAYFLIRSAQLVLHPGRRSAMANFHASLVQLSLLLAAAIADATLLHYGGS